MCFKPKFTNGSCHHKCLGNWKINSLQRSYSLLESVSKNLHCIRDIHRGFPKNYSRTQKCFPAKVSGSIIQLNSNRPLSKLYSVSEILLQSEFTFYALLFLYTGIHHSTFTIREEYLTFSALRPSRYLLTSSLCIRLFIRGSALYSNRSQKTYSILEIPLEVSEAWQSICYN